MNARELLIKILRGHLIIVGEVRAADVKESGYVDKKNGIAVTTWLINYFVELPRDDGFRFAKLVRRVPRDAQAPAEYPTGVEKGCCYAFEVELMELKNGILSGRLSAAEPALLDAGEGAPAVDAPKGAAMAGVPASLVYLQTTPRIP